MLEPIADARVAVRMLAPTDPRGLRSIVALRDYAVGETIFVNESALIADTVNVTYAFPAVDAEFIASIVGACSAFNTCNVCLSETAVAGNVRGREIKSATLGYHLFELIFITSLTSCRFSLCCALL